MVRITHREAESSGISGYRRGCDCSVGVCYDSRLTDPNVWRLAVRQHERRFRSREETMGENQSGSEEGGELEHVENVPRNLRLRRFASHVRTGLNCRTSIQT